MAGTFFTRIRRIIHEHPETSLERPNLWTLRDRDGEVVRIADKRTYFSVVEDGATTYYCPLGVKINGKESQLPDEEVLTQFKAHLDRLAPATRGLLSAAS